MGRSMALIDPATTQHARTHNKPRRRHLPNAGEQTTAKPCTTEVLDKRARSSHRRKLCLAIEPAHDGTSQSVTASSISSLSHTVTLASPVSPAWAKGHHATTTAGKGSSGNSRGREGVDGGTERTGRRPHAHIKIPVKFPPTPDATPQIAPCLWSPRFRSRLPSGHPHIVRSLAKRQDRRPWRTSSPTTRSPSSRRPSASSTRTATVSCYASRVSFLRSLAVVITACLDLYLPCCRLSY
jgi:hypothetical protein